MAHLPDRGLDEMPRSTQHLGVGEPVQQLELDAARVEHGMEESVSGGAQRVLGHGLSRRLVAHPRGSRESSFGGQRYFRWGNPVKRGGRRCCCYMKMSWGNCYVKVSWGAPFVEVSFPHG